jgi:hypothetical protein
MSGSPEKMMAIDKVDALVTSNKKATHGIGLVNHYEVECLDIKGNLKWKEEFSNLVVDVGLNDALDKYLKGSGYTASFFVGLTDGSPTAAASDTMASHVGWVEVSAYSESTREALVLGSVASKSVNNAASKASFAVNADSTTVGGAFVVTSGTKAGSSGVLYSVGAFTGGNKSVDDGDTLNVTVTLTSQAV